MARWARYLEIYLICSVWPVMGIAGVYGGWRLLLWSYGGRDVFRKLVMQDPAEEAWFQANPRQVFFRDAPLQSVPYHIVDKPDGSPDGHQHHNNY